MRILCRVAATFRQDKNPEITYDVGPRDLMVIRDAPGWIADTRLFGLLKKDGSIEVIETKAQAKQAENEPGAGVGADGKKPAARGRKPKPGAGVDPVKDEQTGNEENGGSDEPEQSGDEIKGDGE